MLISPLFILGWLLLEASCYFWVVLMEKHCTLCISLLVYGVAAIRLLILDVLILLAVLNE